ncbi:jg21831, partial [Pararge aegeria aegeria]
MLAALPLWMAKLIHWPRHKNETAIQVFIFTALGLLGTGSSRTVGAAALTRWPGYVMQLGYRETSQGVVVADDKDKTIEQQIEAAKRQLSILKTRLERRNVRVSKVAEMFISYCEQYAEYDALLTPPEWPNPWQTETTELWEQEKQCKEPLPLRRVRRWSFGLRELLRDPPGREHFAKFLSKEFSGENL